MTTLLMSLEERATVRLRTLPRLHQAQEQVTSAERADVFDPRRMAGGPQPDTTEARGMR